MSSSKRKDWDTYFMDIAYMAATRSQCSRRQVGAVLVKGKKLLGSAYNGAPMGVPDCAEAGCLVVEEYEHVNENGEEQLVKRERCIRTIHAEQNLLLFTDREDREGSTVYVTDMPCWTCANMLANSGIKEIVYHRPYPKDADKVHDLMQHRCYAIRRLERYEPMEGLLRDVTD